MRRAAEEKHYKHEKYEEPIMSNYSQGKKRQTNTYKYKMCFVNIVVMWIVLIRENVTASVSGRIDKGTEKRLEMMWCQHGCHSCKEQEVYNAVRTTHCATETIDSLHTKGLLGLVV